MITGDFVRSVQDNFDARGISVKYGVARGANTVSAKTMRSPGGGATIYVPLWLVIGQANETPANLKYRVSYLLHMAAHEATHALNIAQGESAEAVFGAMSIATASDQYYAQEAGTIIEEYRAQVTAEQ